MSKVEPSNDEEDPRRPTAFNVKASLMIGFDLDKGGGDRCSGVTDIRQSILSGEEQRDRRNVVKLDPEDGECHMPHL